MKIDFLNLTLPELEEYILSIGEQKFRAKQIYEWMYKGFGFAEMSNLPQKLRDKLSEVAIINLPQIKRKLVSSIDGTVKYLFSLRDGQAIESVVMEYEHGNTICISCQAGCRMGCKFCASTLKGRARNLEPSEMLGQIIVAQKDLGKRISNIVMMGIGEPLDNYNNVIKFLKLVNNENGLNIGYRHISLSTCGLADKIRQLAKEGLPIPLSVSLPATTNEARSEIMPINNKWSIEELLSACNEYFRETGRRISFEYTLIDGVNDAKEDADRLANLLKTHLPNMPVHVNLIPVNEVKEREFKKSSDKRVKDFVFYLNSKKINATVRRRLGADINASCGQLRNEQA